MSLGIVTGLSGDTGLPDRVGKRVREFELMEPWKAYIEELTGVVFVFFFFSTRNQPRACHFCGQMMCPVAHIQGQLPEVWEQQIWGWRFEARSLL